MYPISCLSVSCLNIFCLISLVSQLLSHIMSNVSHLYFLSSPVSRLLSHISCLRSPVSCLPFPYSCLLTHSSVSFLVSPKNLKFWNSTTARNSISINVCTCTLYCTIIAVTVTVLWNTDAIPKLKSFSFVLVNFLQINLFLRRIYFHFMVENKKISEEDITVGILGLDF